MQFNLDDVTDINPPSWLPVVQAPAGAAGNFPLPRRAKGEVLVFEQVTAPKKSAPTYPSNQTIVSSEINPIGFYELTVGLVDNFYRPGMLVDLHA